MANPGAVQTFVRGLDVSPSVKAELLAITPRTFTGCAFVAEEAKYDGYKK